MRKVLKTILTMCLLLSLVVVGTLNCFAVENDTQAESKIFSYWLDNFEVQFDTNSTFSAEEQEAIANYLVNSEDNATTDEASTYGLICWISGHKLQTEVVVVIEHKVSATEPRCRKNVYDVSTCSRCDYVEEELIGSMMIDCCD